jgi:hypothetical protein
LDSSLNLSSLFFEISFLDSEGFLTVDGAGATISSFFFCGVGSTDLFLIGEDLSALTSFFSSLEIVITLFSLLSLLSFSFS